MPLYGGVWYGRWDRSPGSAAAATGLIVDPYTLAAIAASARGAPVTVDHAAADAVGASAVGGERAAVAAHRMNIGTVVAAWIDRAGAARAVVDIAEKYRATVAMIDVGILSSFSATHAVGSTQLVELAVTASPARPGCAIDGKRVPTLGSYIAAHPPEVTL